MQLNTVDPPSQTDNSPADSPLAVLFAHKFKALDDQLIVLKKAENARQATQNLSVDKFSIGDLVSTIVVAVSISLFAAFNFIAYNNDLDGFNKVNNVVIGAVLIVLAIVTVMGLSRQDDLRYQRQLKYVLVVTSALCGLLQLAPLVYDYYSGNINFENLKNCFRSILSFFAKIVAKI